MNAFFKKTLGGLSREYYFRQFCFGLLFYAFFVYMTFQSSKPFSELTVEVIVWTVFTLLYPYSRFVYERIVGFIMGDSVFFINVLFSFIIKFTTMLVCWFGAVVIAPIGLVYLYFYHSKNE